MKKIVLVLFPAIAAAVFGALQVSAQSAGLAQGAGREAAQEYELVKNIYYGPTDADDENSESDVYIREKCVLDVYYPEGAAVAEKSKGFKTIVWFHGGGLETGSKDLPALFLEKGVCIVTASYRLSPKVNAPAYIEDAAWAVAWAVANVADYGGDPEEIYVSGHSAGGYLALMLALDKSYLAAHGIDADKIKGYYPISGQTATHYTIRSEMGLSRDIPYFDKYAPLCHVRAGVAPIMLFAGQSELEMACRTAENFYLYEALRSVGNKDVEYFELDGFDHGTVVGPAIMLMLRKMEAR